MPSRAGYIIREESFYKSTIGIVLIAVALIATSAGALYAFKLGEPQNAAISHQFNHLRLPQLPVIESERKSLSFQDPL